MNSRERTDSDPAGDKTDPKAKPINERAPTYEELRSERDLYWCLLELAMHEELKPFLEESLTLIVSTTGAKKGYLALYDADTGLVSFSLAKSCTPNEVASIQQKISRGIIAEALATNQTLSIPSAQEDPRFQENTSVSSFGIEAVLCVPIGLSSPLGVLYLQDREQSGPFSAQDQKRAEVFARHLAPAVDRLLLKSKLPSTMDHTQPYRQRLKLEGLIGRSTAMAEVLRQLESVAAYDFSVLLMGPSGTGKTALARAIHNNSRRAERPFIELNCAAIPENLFESELFGAMPGAHSTATKRLPGKLSAASSGTLFLDEVGELSLSVQGKLLQFLESKEYFPLGSPRAEKADVRVLAATNVDLLEAISQKRFREDLFYRLNVIPIQMPSLAERREDIPLLVEHFCAELSRRHGLPVLKISLSASKAAEFADWPGNVRQLANLVQAAVIRAAAEKSGTLETRHLFPKTAQNNQVAKTQLFHDSTRRFQMSLLMEVLESTQWNVSEAAKRLGLARPHVHALLTSFDIKRDKKK